MTNRIGPQETSEPLDRRLLRAFAGRLRGAVMVPGSDGYEPARLVWNRAIDRRPAVIVRCAHEEDVIRTIELAAASRATLAVRSGGHSQAGHSVCDGGIVLDLGGLNAIHVDPGAAIVRASAGARVAGLIEAMEPHGMTTPTGGCPDVGLGGLTLGGGENLLMAKFGAVCDNVVSARVVTAGGDLLTVSRDEHPDLFWAIRGGGGNFGVVTSFDYRLHPLTRVLLGQLVFPVARTREVLSTYRDLMHGAPDELQTSGGLMSADDGPMLFLAFCHCGHERAGRRLLAEWRGAMQPASDNVAERPFAAEFTMPSVPSVGTGAFLPALSDDVIGILADLFPQASAESMAVWNDYHGAVARVADSDAAFPLRRSGFDLFVMAGWHTPAERARAGAWVGRLRDGLAPHTHGVYVNNLEDEGPDRIREAYGASYARLAAIKARYDPQNLFRMNQNIEPRPS